MRWGKQVRSRNTKHQTPEKTPNTKLQIQNKLQTPSSKMNAGYHWNLGLEVFLVFGVWCFAFLYASSSPQKHLLNPHSG